MVESQALFIWLCMCTLYKRKQHCTLALTNNKTPPRHICLSSSWAYDWQSWSVPVEKGSFPALHLLKHFGVTFSSVLAYFTSHAFTGTTAWLPWFCTKECTHPDAPSRILKAAFQTEKICSQSLYRFCAPGTLWNRTSGWLAVKIYWMMAL